MISEKQFYHFEYKLQKSQYFTVYAYNTYTVYLQMHPYGENKVSAETVYKVITFLPRVVFKFNFGFGEG